MNSAILKTSIRILVPTFWMLAIVIFLRGHTSPGGGFIAGLVAGAAILLGKGTLLGERTGRVHVGVGLICAVASGLPSALSGRSYLSGVWVKIGVVEFGSPMLFDFGVALIVIGMMLIFRVEARRS